MGSRHTVFAGMGPGGVNLSVVAVLEGRGRARERVLGPNKPAVAFRAQGFSGCVGVGFAFRDLGENCAFRVVCGREHGGRCAGVAFKGSNRSSVGRAICDFGELFAGFGFKQIAVKAPGALVLAIRVARTVRDDGGNLADP